MLPPNSFRSSLFPRHHNHHNHPHHNHHHHDHHHHHHPFTFLFWFIQKSCLHFFICTQLADTLSKLLIFFFCSYVLFSPLQSKPAQYNTFHRLCHLYTSSRYFAYTDYMTRDWLPLASYKPPNSKLFQGCRGAACKPGRAMVSAPAIREHDWPCPLAIGRTWIAGGLSR